MRPRPKAIAAAAHFGKLDALINIAGGLPSRRWPTASQNVATDVRAQRRDGAERLARDPASRLIGRADRQYRRDGRAAGRRRHGRLRRLKAGASPHEALATELGARSRQRRTALDLDTAANAPACRKPISQMGDAKELTDVILFSPATCSAVTGALPVNGRV
jgi:NAD(P)-dependent dehydrogenase (short-subunit alcohol dehydrogenase family)